MNLVNASLPHPFSIICISQSLSDRAIIKLFYIDKSKNYSHYTIIAFQTKKYFTDILWKKAAALFRFNSTQATSFPGSLI